MDIQIPKGTFDILPYGCKDAWRLSSFWQWIEAHIRNHCALYNYEEIRTPIYEKTELFDRGVGETSDIVSKEMFTFLDKAGRSLTLRPEGTACIARALITQNWLQERKAHKLFYIAPMFRYERPQSGRYRQHHQFGVEAIGIQNPSQDAEVIDLLYKFYQRLGLSSLRVHLNTVGDSASRKVFREALLDYLKPYKQELSSDSQVRFEKNPLRILDSKDPKDQEILQQAPSLLDYLTPPSAHHFEEVRRLLDQIQIPYVVHDKIVRGLDYYNHTVFEVKTEEKGSSIAIGAGGRYDGLLATVGGADLPAVGFGAGIERILQTLLSQQITPPPSSPPFVYWIPLGEEAETLCFSLVTRCRQEEIPTDMERKSGKLSLALQNALQLGASYCAIIGSDELKNEEISLKDLQTRQTKTFPIHQVLPMLKELFHA